METNACVRAEAPRLEWKGGGPPGEWAQQFLAKDCHRGRKGVGQLD